MSRLRGLGLSLILLAHPMLAQTAILRGNVADPSGAVIPGAKVTATARDGKVKTATADDKGSYGLSGLQPGEYALSASAPELATQQPVTISLHTGTQTLNLQLNVMSESENVTVQENVGPTLSTEVSNNASALVLRGDDLQALADDPDDLLADLQALAGPSAGPNGGSIFIDGFSDGEIPPKESIREIRINSNPFSPEYDTLGYGRIEIFTKPGTDRFHGELHYNYANDIWNSRNPFSAEKAPLLLNELEGEVSGPINKRTSFNFDAQRNMVDNGAIINAITLNPQNLSIQPFLGIFKVPQRYTRVSPRVDYQLNPTNTLIFRYAFTRSDIQGSGIGSFDLLSRGYHYQYTNQTVRAVDTAVFGSTINETRFQYFRSAQERIADSAAPEIQVLGAVNEGGSQVGRSFDTQNYYELQNYTTIPHRAHVWKFGVRLRGQTDDNISPQNFNGTFTFSTIQQYQQTLLLQQMGDSPAQIRAMGGGASQFSINAGLPELAVHRVDVAMFVGDDWRVKSNLTVSAGLRYEAQTSRLGSPSLGRREQPARTPAPRP
jgi:Carboxypeptidase regulatory-like domain